MKDGGRNLNQSNQKASLRTLISLCLFASALVNKGAASERCHLICPHA